jgi:hypothetical protein
MRQMQRFKTPPLWVHQILASQQQFLGLRDHPTHAWLWRQSPHVKWSLNPRESSDVRTSVRNDDNLGDPPELAEDFPDPLFIRKLAQAEKPDHLSAPRHHHRHRPTQRTTSPPHVTVNNLQMQKRPSKGEDMCRHRHQPAATSILRK